jgi:xanthine dehydrogenase small subunit
MKRDHISFIFRGSRVDLAGFSPHATLLDWLRLDAHATGTKEGCAEGDCGACTVVLARENDGELDQRPVNACILLMGQVDGAEILTIEDLAQGSDLHPVQQSMVAQHGSQCGFCTPGIVMSLFALQQSAQGPVTRPEVETALAGNLCRCTGYRPIVDAAMESCSGPAQDRFSERSAVRLSGLAAIDDRADVFVGTTDRFFAAPASEDALAALCIEHPDALILSGATDVGLWITKALQTPPKIIWLGRLRGAFTAIEAGDKALSLGAGLTLADATTPLVTLHPDFAEIMRRFGSAQVRASGTIGGSLANGSPIGDIAPCLIALGAEIELRRGSELRRLPLEAFFIAYKKQDRRPGEYLRRIIIPRPAADREFRAFKVSKRFDEDISAVLGAFHLGLAGRHVIFARIAFGGMAGTPARAPQAEMAAIGIDLDDPATWANALAEIGNDYAPIDDARASAGYRSLIARNLFLKTLMEVAGIPSEITRMSDFEVPHAAE